MAVEPISDDSVENVYSLHPLSKINESEKLIGVDSAASTIEKSKAVRPDIIPPMSFPILSMPVNAESMTFTLASLDASGKPTVQTLQSFVLEGEEVKESVLKGWMQNLREIEEQVRQLLRSPTYLQLQEIRQHGDSQPNSQVGGIEGSRKIGSDVNFLMTLDRLQKMEKVSAAAEVSGTTPSSDSSQVLVLPLTAALLAGGLIVGTEIISPSTQPIGGVVQFIERLQPLFPSVAVQDMIPFINLLVTGPLYYHSWNEAISNLQNRDRSYYIKTAEQFAKDVIKIVSDPHFVSSALVRYMRGVDQLSAQEQARLVTLLKIVLIGVSLSLLYSVEVGKVQKGKFGGIEPEELKALLMGEFNGQADLDKKLSVYEQLTLSLIDRLHEQLATLSREDRVLAIDLLMDYITQTREYDSLLDPAKVFEETLHSHSFKSNEKMNQFKI